MPNGKYTQNSDILEALSVDYHNYDLFSPTLGARDLKKGEKVD